MTRSSASHDDLIPTEDLPEGVLHGVRSTQAWLGEFDWLANEPARGKELATLTDLLSVHGGEALVTWTHGHAVHVLHARAEATGERPAFVAASCRLTAARGRTGRGLDVLKESLAGSVFEPQWPRLERELAGPRLSVTSWFECFGVPGMPELEWQRPEATWETAARVALDLLRGRAADPDEVARLNALISSRSTLNLLPIQASESKPGSLGSSVYLALSSLGAVLGAPKSERWRLAWDAADWLGEITEVPCPASSRFTSGSSPLAAAASAGRLLGLYPTELLRDPLFYLLAGLEVVEIRGGFVFWELAESIDSAGFTLSIHSAADEESFREATGVMARWSPMAEQVAHAFVDLPTAPSDMAQDTLTDWYETRKTDGLLVRTDADGTWSVTRYRDGEIIETDLVIDEERLQAAARDFTPREAVLALGLPDLLEPGEWTRWGDSEDSPHDHAALEERTRRALGVEGRTTTLNGPSELTGALGHVAVGRDLGISLKLEPGLEEDLALDELCDDLGIQWETWLDGPSIVASARLVQVEFLIRVLADMPGPMRLTTNASGDLTTYEW